MKNIIIPISIIFAVRDDEQNSVEKAIVTTECRLFGFLDVDYITAINKLNRFGAFLYEHRKIDLVPIQIYSGKSPWSGTKSDK